MANNLKLADRAANAAMDALTALLNNGFIDIMDGAQPATANTSITTQVNLANLTFGASAFAGAVAGVAAANAIGSDSDINATGTATWARLYKSDHTSAVLDLTVGTTGCDINLNSAALQIHAALSLTSLSLTLPE